MARMADDARPMMAAPSVAMAFVSLDTRQATRTRSCAIRCGTFFSVTSAANLTTF